MARGDEAPGGRGAAIGQFYRYAFGIGHERNVGGTERTVRYAGGALSVLVGLGVLVAPVLAPTIGNAVLALLLGGSGLFLVYEARVQYCPLTQTLDRSTFESESR